MSNETDPFSKIKFLNHNKFWR